MDIIFAYNGKIRPLDYCKTQFNLERRKMGRIHKLNVIKDRMSEGLPLQRQEDMAMKSNPRLNGNSGEVHLFEVIKKQLGIKPRQARP